MLSIEQVDLEDKAQVKQFVELPYRLYKHNAQWVPPLYLDAYLPLKRGKHPYFQHSEGDFFIAKRAERVVGRIGAFENRLYNEYHKKQQAHFYYFECEEDPEAAAALFNRAFDWAKVRGLMQVVGPKGLSILDGYGFLEMGYEQRQMMSLTTYNFPYYNDFALAAGFRKEVDFVCCYTDPTTYQAPERLERIVERVLARGTLRVQQFNSKKELKPWINKVGRAYNNAFVGNWEYYPQTNEEIAFVADNLLTVANPRMLKVIVHGEDVVGFLFAFPDVSRALQRARGRLLPFGLIDLLLEMRRTDWVAVNGMGILPEFQGRGGNALLYLEMLKTLEPFKFKHAEMTQVAETAIQMRSDLSNLYGQPYKNHRVYIRDL